MKGRKKNRATIVITPGEFDVVAMTPRMAEELAKRSRQPISIAQLRRR
jgi:hypothetical protein